MNVKNITRQRGANKSITLPGEWNILSQKEGSSCRLPSADPSISSIGEKG